MAKIKVGINGMGRIGRTVLRQLINRGVTDLEVVAVNDLGDPKQTLHLLKYDSVHGKFQHDLKLDGDTFSIDGNPIKYYGIRNPEEIPWADHGVDLVIDGTGIFKDKAGLGKHLGGSVKKVIMCAPGKDLDATFVMGINHENYDPANHHIVSNASCTTNCLSPVAKVLNDNWGVENGLMVTIHSYTSDQQLLDGLHSDPRRSRSAAISMCPTTTGAAKTVGKIIPELAGKLDGYAVRVPTPNVSLVDLTVTLKNAASKEEINAAMKKAAEGPMKGVFDYTEEELVSVDYMSNPHSSILDASLTNVIGNSAKVIAWYDNEAGFSNRVIDLALMIASKM